MKKEKEREIIRKKERKEKRNWRTKGKERRRVISTLD
jgi:hypothetical protein